MAETILQLENIAMTFQYPPSPELRDDSLLQPSASFKDNVYAMIKGITGFVFLYILMIIGSAALLAACCFIGFGMIVLKPMWLTIAAGLGIAALGIMVFLFLIKFIFAKTSENDPLQIEIKEKDHPQLFAFIRKLTDEVKTDFPKRIFLVPDVNAAVLYNSGFWSMFLPVRKNLRIGLGLVNSLTLSEFKAVLAHEFGHFSQRSMKLGSYVYTMNRVIYNLVNHRDSWDNLLEGWANAGGIFGFFAGITYWIVNQVRELLVSVYQKLNIRYMALSREMEYHADLVACSVSGTVPMIQTLRKIEFTDSTYQFTLSKLNEISAQKKKAVDLYELHTLCTKFLAELYKLDRIDHTMTISDQDLDQHIIKSRLNVKDQWASHPSREDREKNINAVQLPVDLVDTSSWILFTDVEKWKKQMTTHLYTVGQLNPEQMDTFDPESFIADLEQNQKENTLPIVYKGFYDNRLTKEFDFNEGKQLTTELRFEELFSTSTQEFMMCHHANQSDLALLKNLRLSIQKDDVFEFDFTKCTKADIPRLIDSLEKEIESDNLKVVKLEQQVFQYFYALAQKQSRGNEIEQAYQNIYHQQNLLKPYQDLVEKLQGYHNKLNKQKEWTEKKILEFNSVLKHLEQDFKNFIITISDNRALDEISEKEEFEKYVAGSVNYIQSSFFSPEGFDQLTSRMFEVLGLLQKQHFQVVKELAVLQLNFVSEVKP